MRVAFAARVPRSANAGVSGVTLNVGTAMAALGAQVDFYFLDDLTPHAKGMVDEFLFPWRMGARRELRGYDVVDTTAEHTLLNYLPDGPLTVARSHGLEHTTHFDMLDEARRTGRKLSWKYPLYRGSFLLWEEKMALRRSDLALLLNERDRTFAVEQLGVKPDRAHIVPNGLTERFLDLPFDEEAGTGETVRIAFVGSYIESKGIAYLRQALEPVLARHPRVRVSFLGVGCPPETVLADYDPKLHDRIDVVPRYENSHLPALLAGHAINAFPTLGEGFPVSLLEVMACGLVPVVSAVPGPTEFCCDRQNALVVPARDSDAFERALETLIADASLLLAVRRGAYKTAQSYSWRRIAGETLALYEQALSKRRGMVKS